MRLPILHEYDLTFIQWLKVQASQLAFGPSSIDPARTAFYRPEIFQSPYYRLQHQVLRGPSEWPIEERELFAALTAKYINCEFCLSVHSEFATTQRTSPGWVTDMLKDDEVSVESAEIQLIAQFIKKLTKKPWTLTKQDIQKLRGMGISDERIVDAVMVCVVFNIGGRISSVLDFEIPAPSALKRAKPVIRLMGYLLYT